jgi:hypothetical protein
MPVPEPVDAVATVTPGVACWYAAAQVRASGYSRPLPVSVIVTACADAAVTLVVLVAVAQAASAAPVAMHSAALRSQQPRGPLPVTGRF